MNIVSYNLSDFTERFLVKGSENEKYFKTLRDLQINIGDGNFLPFFDFLTSRRAYLAGGFWRRMVENSPMSMGDIDLFFLDDTSFKKTCEILAGDGWTKTAERPHATTYEKTAKNYAFQVQLISMGYYNSAAGLLEDFDFTISQLAYSPTDAKIYANEFTLHDIGKKRLVLHKVKFATTILRRLQKYTSYGYYACNGCMQEITKGIRSIPEDDFLVNSTSYVD